MRAANEAGLDFTVITDHNSLGALQDGLEGWRGRSLALVGVEISLAAGHYLALDVPPDLKWIKQDVQGTIDRVNEAGGYGFLAHPLARWKWKDWGVTGYRGIEIINISTLFSEMAKSRPGRLLFDFGRDGFAGSEHAMRTVMSDPPTRELQKWTHLLASRKTSVVGGADAHALLKLGPIKLRVPSYLDVFRSLHTHALISEPLSGDLEHDKPLIHDALRDGRFYTAYAVWGDAKVFEFSAKSGPSSAVMGETISGGSAPVILSIRVPGDRPVIMRLYCGETVVLEMNDMEAETRAQGKGAYRVEIYQLRGRRLVPWIISNAIYVE